MSFRGVSAFLAIALFCYGSPAFAQQQGGFITNNDPRNPVQVDLSILNQPQAQTAPEENEIILQPPPPRALKIRSLTRPEPPVQRPIPAIDRPKPPTKPVAMAPVAKPAVKPVPVAPAPAVSPVTISTDGKSLVTVPPKPGHKPAVATAAVKHVSPPPPVPESKPVIEKLEIVKSVDKKPVALPLAPVAPAAPVIEPVQAEMKPQIAPEPPKEKPAPAVPVPAPAAPMIVLSPPPAPPIVPEEPIAAPPVIVLPQDKNETKEAKTEIKTETVPEKPVIAPEKPVAPVIPKVSSSAPVPPPEHNRVVQPDAKSAFLEKGPKMIRADNMERAPAKPLAGKNKVSLAFDSSTADLNDTTATALDGVIASLNESEKLRLQLLAYASEVEGSSSSARRLSLSRALAVRAYLMDHGIRPTRVDVRALGSETQEQPVNRVDIIFIE